MRVNIFFKKNSGVVAIIELERGVTGAGIFSIIVGKFRHLQQLCLIILFPIDKCSKIRLYCAILPLRLAICMRLKGYK